MAAAAHNAPNLSCFICVFSGGFMGDIALPEGESFPVVARTPVDDEEKERQEVEQLMADAPASGAAAADAVRGPRIKFNATFQLDLEKLKQEVYHEGLQVEEEGLTDIIRKKTKLPSASPVNLKSAGPGQPQSQVSLQKGYNSCLPE